MPQEPQRATLLRIYVGEDDRYERRPLFMAIVEELRANGFLGATVLKGIEGFGRRGRVRSARAPEISSALPVLVEVAESQAKIEAIVPRLRAMIAEGLLTLETVEMRTLRPQ